MAFKYRSYKHMTQQQGTSASKHAVKDQTPVANGGKFGLTVSAAARITKMLADEPDGSFFRVAYWAADVQAFNMTLASTSPNSQMTAFFPRMMSKL